MVESLLNTGVDARISSDARQYVFRCNRQKLPYPNEAMRYPNGNKGKAGVVHSRLRALKKAVLLPQEREPLYDELRKVAAGIS